MTNNWLHLNYNDNGGFKAFRTWRACANFIFENNLEDYYVLEEGTGIMLVRSFRYVDNNRRVIQLDPEHLPPASVIAFL